MLGDKSLYQLFVDSLKEVLGTVPAQTEEKVVVGETTLATRVYVQHVHTENRVTGTEDQLLKINFQAIFSTVFTEKRVVDDPYDLRSVIL